LVLFHPRAALEVRRVVDGSGDGVAQDARAVPGELGVVGFGREGHLLLVGDADGVVRRAEFFLVFGDDERLAAGGPRGRGGGGGRRGGLGRRGLRGFDGGRGGRLDSEHRGEQDRRGQHHRRGSKVYIRRRVELSAHG
jgi:hypothetical protein